MEQDTQITFKLNSKELEIIKKASEVVGLGHTTLARTSVLKESRKILLENDIKID
jgi:predicted DNA binding CopG/RHH family protein